MFRMAGRSSCHREPGKRNCTYNSTTAHRGGNASDTLSKLFGREPTQQILESLQQLETLLARPAAR
jgi:hypothetical protein